jgi:hypothetical protein
MKRTIRAVIVALSCPLLLIGSDALASLPVKHKSEGCVVGGKVYSLYQGKRQYTFTLPKGFNLNPYEGKKVLLEGELYPGDDFVPQDKTLKILGPCSSGADTNLGAPAQPSPQPAKSTPPPPQAPPQVSKPVPQPQQPAQQPSAKSSPAPTPAPPAAPQTGPAQPTTQKPGATPAPQSATPAACKQNCQRRYDAEIQKCAGYQLGNTAPACKDPIARDLQSCLSACR